MPSWIPASGKRSSWNGETVSLNPASWKPAGGWAIGSQILRGLVPGDKIVVSGNFLIDSESRMKLAAAGLRGDIGNDVVCGKLVDERQADGGRPIRPVPREVLFFLQRGLSPAVPAGPGTLCRAGADRSHRGCSWSGTGLLARRTPGALTALTPAFIPRGRCLRRRHPTNGLLPRTTASGRAGQECCELPDHPCHAGGAAITCRPAAAPGTPQFQPGMPVHPQVIRQVPPGGTKPQIVSNIERPSDYGYWMRSKWQ